MKTENVPTYLDFTVMELILIKKAEDQGYEERNINISEVLGLF